MIGRLGPDFDEFVALASPSLLRAAVLLTGDRGAGEDLLQAALLRTAAHWRKAQRNPAAYTRRVIVNLAKNRWRDRARRPVEVLADHAPEHAAGDDARRIDDHDLLSRLLASLPTRDRQVLVLRYYLDLSVHDVAEMLSCSDGTVKSLTSRALDALRHTVAHSSDTSTTGADRV